MTSNTLFGIEVPVLKKEEVLEKILKYIENPSGDFHIFSLNPEIFVTLMNDDDFKRVATWAHLKIIDGAGVVLAARLNGIRAGDRYAGVDLMDDLMRKAEEYSLRVMIIGGGPKVADKLVDCYSHKYLNLDVFGLQGIQNISSPTQAEEQKIFSIVADRKPHIVFVSFGSPMQEKWLYKHRAKFRGSVCAGVGGAFDFLSGNVKRAPRFIRLIGLEWLFRLLMQPWRIKRQLRLITFVSLVIQEKYGRKD